MPVSASQKKQSIQARSKKPNLIGKKKFLPLNMTITPESKKILQKLAAKEGQTVSSYVRRLIHNHIMSDKK